MHFGTFPMVLYLFCLVHLFAVLAEWKPPVYDNTRGITLVTATTRRNSPNVRIPYPFLHLHLLLIHFFLVFE